MRIFVDSSAISRGMPIGERCRTSARSIVSLAEGLHKRACCRRFSWVSASGAYSLYEFIRIVRESVGGADVVLSEREKRDIKSLANELSSGFVPAKDRCVLCAASHEASLVWALLKKVDETVVSHNHDGEKREVVICSEVGHLQDNAVCCVLYCNHPEVPNNSIHKGYESRSHDNKHFLDTNGTASWIKDTDSVNPGYKQKVSKFCPGIVWGEDRYNAIERFALIDAMKGGKYSLENMAGHIYTNDTAIGASHGAMTRKVCLDINARNRDVHMYPVPETTPDN